MEVGGVGRSEVEETEADELDAALDEKAAGRRDAAVHANHGEVRRRRKESMARSLGAALARAVAAGPASRRTRGRGREDATREH